MFFHFNLRSLPSTALAPTLEAVDGAAYCSFAPISRSGDWVSPLPPIGSTPVCPGFINCISVLQDPPRDPGPYPSLPNGATLSRPKDAGSLAEGGQDETSQGKKKRTHTSIAAHENRAENWQVHVRVPVRAE
eukprot:scaffold649_cov347-Pavlova_lutheri.AAC.38